LTPDLSEKAGIKITYADGRTEIVNGGVKVDYNYHEGTFDFCDENGYPLLQLQMSDGISWEYIQNTIPQ
jgi:hypothetical protein